MPTIRSGPFRGANRLLVWGSLLLRLALVAFVLATGHFALGDSGYYFGIAERVCAGHWGGDGAKPVLYSWFLCALSPGITAHPAAWQLAVPLVVQGAALWLAGAALFRFSARSKSRQLALFFWFFDPALLVLSHLAMSDAPFSLLVLSLALLVFKLLEGSRRRVYAALLGLVLAAALLLRAIALPLVPWTAAVLGVALARKGNWRALALAALVASAALAPQFYWNSTRYGRWNLVLQGGGWMQSVAAATRFAGTGLDFYESESKWHEEGWSKRPQEPYRTLVEKFSTYAWLSSKAAARVLFGHVNVEWAYLFTGESPIGPGWFKVAERRAGPHVAGPSILVWTLGLLLTAGVCVYVYGRTARALLALPRRALGEAFPVWALGSILILVLTPQVWGDARFRAPVWPLVLLLWMWAEARLAK